MKIILEILHADSAEKLHHHVENFPFRVGRGYHNDLILTDPHVGAEHLLIETTENGFMLQDARSVNGTFLNGKICTGGKAQPLSSGDALRLGRTEIRVFLPDHPVAETEKIQKESAAFAFLSRPLYAWGLFSLALAATTLSAWLGTWWEEVERTIAPALAWATGGIFIWAGLWAAAGKVLRHRTFFTAHVALLSAYLIAAILFFYIASMLSFLASENIFAGLADYLGNAALFGLLIYGALTLATRLPRKKRVSSSFFAALGIFAAVLLIDIAGQKRFDEDPAFASLLRPAAAAFVPAQTAEAFFADNTALFDDDLFKKEKDADTNSGAGE